MDRENTVIRPIETYYRGYRFRSRLEARWAVFLDHLVGEGNWEYEPEGFSLGNGSYYLPDFRVRCYGKRGKIGDEWFYLYIEVKGQMSEVDASKIDVFSGGYPVLVVGRIPEEGTCFDAEALKAYDGMDGSIVCPFNYSTIDYDYYAAFPAADECGRFYLAGDDCNYIHPEDKARVEAAYAAARQARFEYGESPEADAC